MGWAGGTVPWLRVLTAPVEPAFGPQNHVGLTMSWDSSHSSSLTVSSHTAGMSSGVLGILKRGKLMSGEELRTGCLLLVSSSVSGLLLFTFKHSLPEPKLSIPYFTSLSMGAVTAECWHMRQCRSHDSPPPRYMLCFSWISFLMLPSVSEYSTLRTFQEPDTAQQLRILVLSKDLGSGPSTHEAVSVFLVPSLASADTAHIRCRHMQAKHPHIK